MPDNLFKRGGIWWGRVKVRGSDLRRSLRTRDRAEAKKRLKALLAEAEHIRFHGEARLTWQAAVMRFIAEAIDGQVKPGTAKRYKVSFRQVDPVLRGKTIDEISRKTIAEVVAARRREGATNATIRRDLTAISAVIADCVGRGEREDNPARDYDRSVIKERRDPITPPSQEAVDEMVRRSPGNFGRCVLFLDQTGMREMEAALLQWPQFDPIRGTVTLYHTKTGLPRAIRLSDAARDTLEGTPRHIKSPYVFWHGDGEPYRNFASRFAAINGGYPSGDRKRPTLPDLDFRCHDLRHRFAINWLIEKGGERIYDLQQYLGHRSIKTTEIYLAFITGHEKGHAGNGSVPVVAGADTK